MFRKKIISTELFSLLFSLSLTGCKANEPIFYEDGYFKYIILEKGKYGYDKNDSEIAIVDFTELGRQQLRVDIPDVINGIPVKRIGWNSENGTFGKKYSYLPTLKSEDKIKKIFFFENIEWIEPTFFDTSIDNKGKKIELYSCNSNFSCINFDENVYLFCYDANKYDFKNENLLEANVAFMNNFNSQDLNDFYRIDNIDENSKIFEPPAPVRNGYNFSGWFTDSNCTNKWNFETTVSISYGQRILLYACWN